MGIKENLETDEFFISHPQIKAFIEGLSESDVKQVARMMEAGYRPCFAYGRWNGYRVRDKEGEAIIVSRRLSALLKKMLRLGLVETVEG